jgi:membrane protease YdiL (CAAX protease family)
MAFVIALIIATIVFLASTTIVGHVPFSVAMAGVLLVSSIPVAFVISAAYSRVPVLRSYMSSLIRVRGVWGWALLALALLPALVLISIPIQSLLSGQAMAVPPLPEKGLALPGLIVVIFLYQFFFFNATGEEAGWRGFALPRLQTRFSPLVSALIIAIFWPPWHLFLWQAEGKPVLTLGYWIEMYIGHALFSLLIVWICNRASGSILVAGVTHAAANTAMSFASFPNVQPVFLPWSIAALVMILLDRMWRRLPSSHPAVHASP